MRQTMTAVKSGDKVSIHYKGTLADGTVFDSSEGRDPLEFTVGAGQVIVGMDKELLGMTVGEKKTITAIAEEAYGSRNDDAQQDVPRSMIPAEVPLEVGMQLQMQSPEGQVIPVSVVSFDDEKVTLDANHMLAGKDLTFAMELVSIN
jgi:FKBP-type peptidyl-prolyl cis-trans isomerase 2